MEVKKNGSKNEIKEEWDRRKLLFIESLQQIPDPQETDVFIEEIGTYDPNREPSAISFNEEAAKKWLANGAQPTEIVAKLLKQAGIEK